MIDCPYCHQGKMQSRGTKNNIKSLQCNECRKWKYVKVEPEGSEIEYGRNFINVVCSSKRVLSEQDIRKQFQIDSNEWEIERLKVKTSEGYRKDRSVEWEVSNGMVTRGEVHDSGKMLVVPMYHVTASFVRKTKEIREKLAVYDLKEDALKLTPRYPKLTYPKHTDGMLYEIGMPDIHFGLLTWDKETGYDYDINIARETVIGGITKLLQAARNYQIEKILLPIGNDFFNVDGKNNATSHDTPQQEDTRWQKTFKEGRRLMVDVVDLCASVAPVDVIIIPGNHDEERAFYLGDSLESWYHSVPNVSVDNSPKSRKYYLYGSNLIGLAHGYYEPVNKLPLIMAKEARDLWAQSTYQEWHLGDKHHKKDMLMLADESHGMLIRILRAISPSSAWTFNKGFMSLKASEGFVWHKDNHVVAQFTVAS